MRTSWWTDSILNGSVQFVKGDDGISDSLLGEEEKERKHSDGTWMYRRSQCLARLHGPIVAGMFLSHI